MKKQTINFSWPAQLSDFSTDTAQENFSRGKLKVFYEGETADHRYFSKAFSKELVKTLPYTPIVSYYDDEKDDFVGHATEQQILGIVDPCRDYTFEEDENGEVWCVCDVVLYTERPDKVGDLAKKIVGHKQSLELDPRSVEYTINYDEKRHFKNIEFTAGKFVGVSVLGNDQKPAFTGSSFFTCDEQFENKMKLLREYCETKNDQKDSGGNTMNLEEFMTLSWGDISSKVDLAITKEYEAEAYTYVIDMFEDSAIVRFYSYIDGSSTLQRVKYSVNDNGEIALGDVNEVHVTYEDIIKPEVTMTEETGVTQTKKDTFETTEEVKIEEVETPAIEEVETEVTEPEENKEESTEFTVEETVETPAEETPVETEEVIEESTEKVENNFVDAACEDGGDANSEEEAAQVDNAEVTTTNEKVSVEENETAQETSSSSTSFTESERAEFEALKREKKVALVDSYKEDLTEEEYNDFITKIDDFSEDSLELSLLKAYKRNQASKEESRPIRAFAFAPVQESNNDDALDAFVRKNIR